MHPKSFQSTKIINIDTFMKLKGFDQILNLCFNMLSTFIKFSEYLAKSEIRFMNKGLNDIMRSYSFYYVNQNIENLQNDIFRNFNESRIIIINQNIQSDPMADELYFFISFQKTLIIIKQTSIAFLKSLFSNSKELKICFLSNSKENFEKNIKIQYHEIENNLLFQKEIAGFRANLDYIKPAGVSFSRVHNLIFSCISGYLIKNSYEKLNKNRIDNFFTKRKEEKKLIKNLDENEYIILRSLGCGSIFITNLIYHIKKEELFAIKQSYGGDFEIQKLNDREIKNYLSISHPFLPEFYGTTKEDYLIIEFIDGCTLESIEEMHLSYNEKITIIFEMLMVFMYLHKNNYIFRDLKPNNIMIDRNKTVVLIDFDRMVGFNHISLNSVDFMHDYAAPEIILGMKPTDKCDIYSIGKVIYYIFIEKQEEINSIYYNLFNPIKIIYESCTLQAPEDRPSSFGLISVFYTHFYSILNNCQILNGNKEYNDLFEIERINKIKYLLGDRNDPKVLNSLGVFFLKSQKKDVKDVILSINYLKMAAFNGNVDAQYNLGVIYEQGLYVQRNIEESINYYTLAAKQNHSESQCNLGIIYFTGEYVSKNINKAAYYFTLSANQNNPVAQYNLGIYYREYAHDIDKSLYYCNLSANQNYYLALFTLGLFYFEGLYVERDKTKAIHYFSVAAHQNFAPAITYLGYIYESNDISKAINYYLIASNLNDPVSQTTLGLFYLNGIYVPQNINKALQYFFSAAKHNFPMAQYNLGHIYFKKDLNKSIYYFTLAANQNYSDSQSILGNIYSNNKLPAYDIKKAIYYFKLASSQNDFKSQIQLGYIYSSGQYVPIDFDLGIHYFKMAADQNISTAQFNLGILYYEAKQDYAKAFHYFSLASKNGYDFGYYFMGEFYENGYFVEKDTNKSIYYYKLAAIKHAVAQFRLGIMYEKGILVKKDINRAISYYSLAVNQNHAGAQYKLGRIYYANKTVQNIFDGINLMIKASNNGNKLAYFVLGYIYMEGKYIKRDIQKSIHYYKEASSFNNACAKNNLGVIYTNGFGDKTIQNIANAFVYFKEAKKLECRMANYNLSILYLYDECAGINIDKSIKLIIKSLNNFCPPFNELLCLALIKKYNFKINTKYIKYELDKYLSNSNNLLSSIIKLIDSKKLNNISIFQERFMFYRYNFALFDDSYDHISLKNIINQDIKEENRQKFNLTSDFYKGFNT